MLSANQQLIYFHLNRVMKAKIKASKQKANVQNDTIVEQLQDEEEAAADGCRARARGGNTGVTRMLLMRALELQPDCERAAVALSECPRTDARSSWSRVWRGVGWCREGCLRRA